jgi:hypothetical protein
MESSLGSMVDICLLFTNLAHDGHNAAADDLLAPQVAMLSAYGDHRVMSSLETRNPLLLLQPYIFNGLVAAATDFCFVFLEAVE